LRLVVYAFRQMEKPQHLNQSICLDGTRKGVVQRISGF
jgi:hypothetical protein